MPTSALPLLDTAPFRVSGWRIQPSLLRASTDDHTRQLEPKVMGVLCTLALRAGDPVTRQELFEAVWPDTIVTDDVLTRCISELRKLFGDQARDAHVIETVPRVGYRLIAPVAWAPAGGDSLPEAVPDLEPVVAPALAAPTRWRRWIALAIGGVLILAVGYALGQRPDVASRPLVASPVTSTPGSETHAALSPDGDRVAYAGVTEDVQNLYVGALGGGAPLQVTDASGWDRAPRWSPDGQRLAFIRETEEDCHLMVVSAVGGPMQTVASCPGMGRPGLDWSPTDSRQLVVSSRVDEEPALHFVDVESGELEAIDYDQDGVISDGSPRFSPDGTRVLLSRTVGELLSDLFLLDLATGEVRRVTHGSALVVGHTWVDDDTVLYALAQSPLQQPTLWQVNVSAEADPEWIPISAPGLRPDARAGRVVFEQWRMDANLYALDLLNAESEPEPFSPSTAFDAMPSISPDGQRVAFLSERSGSLQVWMSDAMGTRAEQLTFHDAVLHSPPSWSPNGQRLVFVGLVDGQTDLFVIDRLGEAPRRIVRPSSNEFNASWSSDGQWLYAASDQSGRQEIWRIPVSGGDGVQVSQNGGSMVQTAPNSDALYIVRSGEAGLWWHETPRSPEVQVDSLFEGREHNWTVTSRGVVSAVRESSAKPRVLRWIGENAPPIRSFEASRGLFGLALFPGADRALIGRIDATEVDLASVTLAER
ncbi:MAG: hypothetical protein Rubg2KO_26560 [Rubricoccaceae bacterium]